MEENLGTATLENKQLTSRKGADAYTSQHRNSIPEYITQKNCNVYTLEGMNSNIYSSTVCKEEKIHLKYLSRTNWKNAWNITQKDNVYLTRENQQTKMKANRCKEIKIAAQINRIRIKNHFQR